VGDVSAFALDQLRVDLTRRSATGPRGDVHLTPLEYRVLECLARHEGMIVRQSQLIEEVWGPHRLGDTRNLRVCMKSLRQKLEPDPRRPKFLVTETGVGYRLYSNESLQSAPADPASQDPPPGC
jgi:two-component system KDP operon response regulator KdpE